MNRKSTATLLLVLLMLCLLASSYLGGAATSSEPHPDDGGRQYDNGSNSNSFFYQRNLGPSDGNVSLVNLWANRVVKIGDYGLITVNDTVMVRNNGSVTAFSWTFYLPSDVYPKLKYLAAYVNVTKLDVVGAPPYLSYVGMRVDFGKVGGLPANSSLPVRIIQQYLGIVKPVISTRSLAVYFYRYIVSPYVTMNHNSSIQMSYIGTPQGRIFYAGKTINPFNCSRLGEAPDGAWLYRLNTPVVEIVNIDRRVELDPGGYLTSTETHVVKNLGPANLTNFRLTLPLSVINGTLEAHDSVGVLTSRTDGRNVTVTIRLILQVNWTYTYYISYKTLLDDYRTVEGGLDVIRMQSTTVSDCSVNLEKVVVVFPSHTSLSSISQYADGVQIQDGKLTISYTFRDIAPMNVKPIEFKYNLDIAQTLERPILISLGFFLIGFIYVSARKLVPGARPVTVVREEEKAREQRGLIKEFSSNYEEKTALTLESEQLAEDRRKGRINKRAYVERLNVARRRIASLTNLINEEKRKLSLASKRYASMITQLDTYEEERENAKASLENLEFRRRQGKVAGDVYNRLKYENTKKIEKATSSIDSIIMQFHQETL
nr:hypothetical protein [Candidatus Njordarchaeum guaymaensis]